MPADLRHRADRAVGGGDARAGAPGGSPVDRAAAQPAHGRGRRRLPHAGFGGSHRVAPHPGRAVPRPGLPGESRPRPRSRRCAPTPRCSTSPTTVDLAVVITPVAALAEVVAQCGAKQACGLVVVTETGDPQVDRDLAAQARAVRDAGGRAHLAGRHLHRARAQRLPVADPAARRAGRLLLAVGTAGRGAAGAGASGAGSGSRRSSRPATRPTSAATPCCSTGRRTRPPTWCVLYLETVGNPRKFARLARRISRRKPVVALMTGAPPTWRPRCCGRRA